MYIIKSNLLNLMYIIKSMAQERFGEWVNFDFNREKRNNSNIKR